MKNSIQRQMTIAAFLFFITAGLQTVMACSITSSGSCAGTKCPSDQSCKKTSDFKCECVADKSQIDESLDNHLTGNDEPEMFLSDPGRPGVKRFFVGADGLGSVRCGSCSTSNGCNAFWIPFNMNTTCIATAVSGHQFEYWTINGNHAGNKTPRRLGGKPGTKIVGKFIPEADADDPNALGFQNWSLSGSDDYAEVKNGTSFEAVVLNSADATSPVNLLINDNVFDQLDIGASSETLHVPVDNNGDAVLKVTLVEGSKTASGTTRHTAH